MDDNKLTPDLNSKIDSISNGSVGHDASHEFANKPIETGTQETVDDTSTGAGGFMDKAGDMIEGLGHKIADAGAPGIGQKIHDLGDKLEKEHKDKNHPHDV